MGPRAIIDIIPISYSALLNGELAISRDSKPANK